MVDMSYLNPQNHSMDPFIASNMDSQWALPEPFNVEGKFSLRGKPLSRRGNSSKACNQKRHPFIEFSNGLNPKEDRCEKFWRLDRASNSFHGTACEVVIF